jgi:putative acetyltransferase
MNIRPEKPGDEAAIGEVVAAAFGGRQEADLVTRLRENGDLVLSLVVEDAGRIVAHVAFSRVWVERDGTRSPGIGLAPVAVLPEAQRKGTARALIGAGHLRLKLLGEKIVFVLGDPDYYKRFGFSHELAAPFTCVYQGEHLQALRLSPDAPEAGEVIYSAAFAGLE